MLRRVHIQGYKSLADVEVSLQPLSVLFGPNATGKSNFLDALQLLARLATSRTLKEAFESPYRGTPLESFAFGAEGIKGLLSREAVRFSIEADIDLSQSAVDVVNRRIREMKKTPEGLGRPASQTLTFVRERFLRYRIEVEILPKSGSLRVADEYVAALTTKGAPTAKRKPFLELVGGELHLRMEGQAHPRYHNRYLDHSLLSLPLYPPHYPHLAALRQELESWLFFYFEPRERMRALNPVKEVRHIGLMGEDLAAFLNTLKALDLKQFRAVEKALHMVIPSVTGIEVEVNASGEVELRLLEGGTPVPARVVSEGTLRVLGLLALGGAQEPPALVGFEEPENGVHPGRLRHIAELLKTRAATGESQLIVTTHSALLPDLISDNSLLVCSRRQGKTEIRPFSSWGALGRSAEVRSSLDEEEGAEESRSTVSSRILRGDFDA